MGKNKSITKGVKSPELEKLADATKDEISEFGKGFFKQLVGFSLDGKTDSPDSYQKSPDQPLVVKDPVTGAVEVFNAANNKNKVDTKKHTEKAPRQEAQKEAAINYHRDLLESSERALDREKEEMKKRLQEILDELKRLISSSKVLQMEFADVSVAQTPPQVGEYHLTFFDWLLITIRAARQKVEDSGAWLKTVKSKKNKKGYWGMFKKHGTTFGLSNERVVATQTG